MYTLSFYIDSCNLGYVHGDLNKLMKFISENDLSVCCISKSVGKKIELPLSDEVYPEECRENCSLW